MARILNQTETTFAPATQTVINNAAANCGVDEVTAVSGGAENLFDFYDENENYVFSIDTDNNTVYER